MEPVTGLEEGYEIQLPANTFTKTGCRFVGWSVENDNDPEYSDRFVNVTFYASYNSNLYAVWEDETTALTVTFTANGGSGSIRFMDGRGRRFICPETTLPPLLMIRNFTSGQPLPTASPNMIPDKALR